MTTNLNNNKTIGPLHGLPISFKDQFHIKGVDTTIAYVGWIGTQANQHDIDEGELVRGLLSLGAIPTVKVLALQNLLHMAEADITK